MNVAILGAEQPSQIVAQIIEQNYNVWLEQKLGEKINVVAFVSGGGGVNTPNIGNIPVLNLVQFALLYHKKLIDKIIFIRENFEADNVIISHLRIMGIKIEDICLANRLTNSINIINFVETYLSSNFLPQIEYQIADHCNLNCKACDHYCGLVKNPVFPVFEKFEKDFEQLHKFIDDIGRILILGGEPLLNPEIDRYIELSRRLYPIAKIIIITNAILLPKMPEKFFDTVRENNVVIQITFYPPMQSKMQMIKNLLTEKQVNFTIGNMIQAFMMRQTLQQHDDINKTFLQCHQSRCNMLYDGKVAACNLPFMTKYFNAYFNKNLPQDGALDLYAENLNAEKIKRHLLTPFERCRYCTQPKFIKWDTVKQPSKISDWTNDHLIAN